MQKVNKDMVIGEVLRIDDGIAEILMRAGMHCLGCPSAQMESIKDACEVHGIDCENLVGAINEYLESK